MGQNHFSISIWHQVQYWCFPSILILKSILHHHWVKWYMLVTYFDCQNLELSRTVKLCSVQYSAKSIGKTVVDEFIPTVLVCHLNWYTAVLIAQPWAHGLFGSISVLGHRHETGRSHAVLKYRYFLLVSIFFNQTLLSPEVSVSTHPHKTPLKFLLWHNFV